MVDFNAHNFTADFMLFWYGLAAQAALQMRDVTGVPGPRTGAGFMVEANYVLPMIPLAPGASFATTWPFTGDYGTPEASTLPKENELAFFASYFFHQHLLKVQLEYELRWGTLIKTGTDRIRLLLQASL